MEKEKMTKADYLLALLFGIIVVIQAAQVVFRYVLNNSLVWAEELSRLIFSWIVMVGAVVAIKEGKHICIDFVVEKLPKKFQRYLHLFNMCVIVVFSIFITFVGFQLVENTKNSYTPALLLPLNYVFYAALPVCSIFAVYVSVRLVASQIKHFNKTKNER